MLPVQKYCAIKQGSETAAEIKRKNEEKTYGQQFQIRRNGEREGGVRVCRHLWHIKPCIYKIQTMPLLTHYMHVFINMTVLWKNYYP